MTTDREAELDWKSRRAIVLHEAAYRCAVCCAEATEVDHIWPRRLGGTDDLSNLRAICQPCNRVKGGRALVVFATSHRAHLAACAFMDRAVDALVEAERWWRLSQALAEAEHAPEDVSTDEVVDAWETQKALPEYADFCLDIVRTTFMRYVGARTEEVGA